MQTGTIRLVRASEIEQLSALIRNTLLISNSSHYDMQVVRNLSRQYTARHVRDMALRREMFIHLLDTRITGTISLKDETLFSFFVAPDVQRTGIGTQLLEFAEKTAKNRGELVLRVGASITAKGFYELKGFAVIREEGDKAFGTVFNMEKKLGEKKGR
ncbi:MAG: GNAT family N-acetyltransferase [Spirochaetales bacterium]|jgi:GNAT superfamily N-acetyltransferase|nr:GNAT family N-acetyltransferase [Spirochaetales bacterium]